MEIKVQVKVIEPGSWAVTLLSRSQPRMRWGKSPLGTVLRTGSLPSCTRYHAYDKTGLRVGASQRTRRDAVALLTKETS